MRQPFLPILFHELARKTRKLGGTVRPCTYQVVVNATLGTVAVRLPDDQGPYVCVSLETLVNGASDSMALTLQAGGRWIIKQPVSVWSICGVAQYGLDFPAPVFLAASESLVIGRYGTLAESYYQIAGFHTEPAVWQKLKATEPELFGMGLGPIQQGIIPTVEQYSFESPVSFRCRRIVQERNPNNMMAELRVAGRPQPLFIDNGLQLLNQRIFGLAAFTNIYADIDIMLDERVMFRRQGTPITTTQPLSLIGWRL